jgi:hypothetical protein
MPYTLTCLAQCCLKLVEVRNRNSVLQGEGPHGSHWGSPTGTHRYRYHPVVLLSGLELERDLRGATSHFNDAQGFFVKGLGAGAMEHKGGRARWLRGFTAGARINAPKSLTLNL